MEMANWHTYQVLTKRSERLRDMLSGKLEFAAEPAHIWWGVSVENRQHGLPRIEHLRRLPPQVRFLSIEPLLEDLGEIDLTGIDWVIVGGESGPGARPMKPGGCVSIRKSVPRAASAVLLQAMGRGAKSQEMEELLDGPHLRRVSAARFASVPELSRCVAFEVRLLAENSGMKIAPLCPSLVIELIARLESRGQLSLRGYCQTSKN